MNGPFRMNLVGKKVSQHRFSPSLSIQSFPLLVLMEAEPVRHHLLTNCASSRECLQAAKYLRKIFLKYPVSAKHYDDSSTNSLPSSSFDSIFKWG